MVLTKAHKIANIETKQRLTFNGAMNVLSKVWSLCVEYGRREIIVTQF